MAAHTLARRTPLAAVLLAVLVAALLGTWFAAGWSEVRRRQDEVRLEPQGAANLRAQDVAGELRDRIDALLVRENQHDYAHYQNMFHDNKAIGRTVTPSPLANGPEDPLVLGYFQIDAQKRVTTPGINDDFPNLSDTKHLVQNRSFRDEVSRELAAVLAPERSAGPLIARVDPPPVRPRHPVAPVTAPIAPPQQAQAQTATRTYQVDPSTYAQNTNSNAVYWENCTAGNFGCYDATNAKVVPENAGDGSATQPGVAVANVPPEPPVAYVTPHPEPPAPVTITVSAFEWHTLPFAGAPALVAVRQVTTPDASFAQGFVIDRATLTALLASRAGTMVATLHAASHGDASVQEFVPGWQVSVLPNPSDVAVAAVAADGVARTFVMKFAAVGTLAVLTAMIVLVLFSRTERLARERSQFAAAAAHELRTPLAGLQLYGDMLADGLGEPSKVRDYARRMSEEASRLGRVVSNVLGFSQLERGNLSVDPQPAAVDAALRELAERAEPALDRAGAALELDVAPGLHAKFDRDGLARIVANLLDNAEKYSRGADDRTIRLAAAATDDAVEIVVADHGPGVRDRSRLFRPFTRGVTSDGPAGLGLGLALSRSLARAMGGELAYRTPADGGASFVVSLPKLP